MSEIKYNKQDFDAWTGKLLDLKTGFANLKCQVDMGGSDSEAMKEFKKSVDKVNNLFVKYSELLEFDIKRVQDAVAKIPEHDKVISQRVDAHRFNMNM